MDPDNYDHRKGVTPSSSLEVLKISVFKSGSNFITDLVTLCLTYVWSVISLPERWEENERLFVNHGGCLRLCMNVMLNGLLHSGQMSHMLNVGFLGLSQATTLHTG